MMRLFAIALIGFYLVGSPAYAKKQAEEVAATPAKCGELQAHTVFLEDKTGSRQKGSAELISKQHELAEKGGWNFDEMSLYVEDGDLQGFFITYTRPHPCNN